MPRAEFIVLSLCRKIRREVRSDGRLNKYLNKYFWHSAISQGPMINVQLIGKKIIAHLAPFSHVIYTFSKQLNFTDDF